MNNVMSSVGKALMVCLLPMHLIRCIALHFYTSPTPVLIIKLCTSSMLLIIA